MTKTLEFSIERPGFPVKIGDVELWFDDSPENLIKFFKAKEIIVAKEKEINEKLKQYENLTEETITYEQGQEILKLKKEYISTFFDLTFEKGCFDKVYEKYPYVNELENLLPTLELAISETIEEREKKRNKRAESIKKQYLEKKKTKRNKK